jgi:hypothetical protein
MNASNQQKYPEKHTQINHREVSKQAEVSWYSLISINTIAQESNA